MSARSDAALARFSPAKLDANARKRIAALLELIGGYRRLAWRRQVARRVVWVGARALPLVAVIVVCLRAAWIAEQHDGGLTVAAVALTLALAIWVVAHRLPWFEAARRVDDAGQGSDRAATAVELAVVGRRDAWVQVQAGAANRWADSQTPAELLPLDWPKGIHWLLAGILLVALAVVIPARWLASNDGGDRGRVGLSLWLPAPPDGFTSVADLLSADDREMVELDRRLIADIEQQLRPGQTKDWLRQVGQVLEDVERGAIDKTAALARLAELERQQPAQHEASGQPKEPAGVETGAEAGAEASAKAPDEGSGQQEGGGQSAPDSVADKEKKSQDADRAVRGAVARALEESLKGAPKGDVRDALREAAAKKDLEGISKWVERLAEQEWTDKELEKWIKVAERFAGKMADRKIPKRFEKLASRVRRLQSRRKQQGGLNAADRRRLKSTRRSLQQLRKEHGDMAAAGHRLKRLERNARRAANELRRGQRSRLARGASKAQRAQDEARRRREQGKRFRRRMGQAANELRRESQRQKQGHARRIGQARLRDLREALGRSQRNAGARRDFEKRAGSQRAAVEARARERAQNGRQGKRGKPGDRMRQAGQAGRKAGERAARAKQQAKGAAQGRKPGASQGKRQGVAKGQSPGSGQGKRGRQGGIRLGQGDMSGQTRMRMMRAQAQGGHGDSKPGGDGAGQGPGGANKGKRSAMRAGRTEKVQGIHGKGPTVKQTFLEAARRGFARRSWRKVYADYNAVAQEMMDKETLPAGRKAMVRRYFELIRPRE